MWPPSGLKRCGFFFVSLSLRLFLFQEGFLGFIFFVLTFSCFWVHGGNGIDIKSPPPGMQCEVCKLQTGRTSTQDHTVPSANVTPPVSTSYAGQPRSSPTGACPISPQQVAAILRCVLVFAGLGVKVDEVHKLLIMKNLDGYTLFTKDSVAPDTSANIGLSLGTIEKIC